ncbi:MAG: S1 RNA-binding domain-containing protein, partial [Ruoffia tabacinasalis]
GPWDNIEEKAPEGSELKGTVKRLTSFGAFVEVFPGVEGLVHISQIAHEHIATPHERLEEGQEIDVKVLSVDPEQNRLSLSVKALLDQPEGMEESPAPAASSNKPRRENNKRNTGNKKQNRQRNFQDSSDDSDSGFTLADMLGDQLDQFKGE